jgi:hypothetical protein
MKARGDGVVHFELIGRRAGNHHASSTCAISSESADCAVRRARRHLELVHSILRQPEIDGQGISWVIGHRSSVVGFPSSELLV